MAWYDTAVFYHMYPLGLCGCPHENDKTAGNGFDTLNAWAAHAANLFCTAIYIGPLFESEQHGYDTRDYRRVDSRLGTNEDFAEFVRNCHARGQKVIVDGVFNHTGRSFFAFDDLRRNRESSPYRDWYAGVNFWGNNEYNDGFSYDSWQGYNHLPRLNLYNDAVRSYHLDSIRFWVSEFDIDGIRLDAADQLNFDFLQQLRAFCDSLKKDFFLLGEVIHGDYSRWANQTMLHSVTNYELHKALWSGHNDHNYFEIAHTIRRQMGLVGDRRLYTFTDNHDVSRIVNKLRNRAHMKNVAILQYALYGIPSLYYGSEFGVEGEKQNGSDWNLRPALSLSDFDENGALPSLFRRLGELKKEVPALSFGQYRELSLTTEQYAFARVLDGCAVVAALNNADHPTQMQTSLPIAASTVTDLLAAPQESEEERAALEAAEQEERRKKLADLQGNLFERSGQLLGASGEIREKADHLRAYLSHADFSQEGATEDMNHLMQGVSDAMENMQRVLREFTDAAGLLPKQEVLAPATEPAEGVRIADGKLFVDLAPNDGMLLYLTQ